MVYQISLLPTTWETSLSDTFGTKIPLQEHSKWMQSHSDKSSYSLEDNILNPLKNLVHTWSHITEISRPMFATFSVLFSIFFFTLCWIAALFFGANLSCPQEKFICHMDIPWLLGRYPESSTQPPGTSSAVFWAQNHSEQLVLSSVIPLPIITNWCFGEITKRDIFVWF